MNYKKKKKMKRRLRGMMWLVVIGFVLMCLDQTWCDSLWLVLSWCVWTKPYVTRCDWCDLIVVRNLKSLRKLQNSKMNSIIQERDWHKKKIRNFKSLRRISKETILSLKYPREKKVFKIGWIWMMNSLMCDVEFFEFFLWWYDVVLVCLCLWCCVNMFMMLGWCVDNMMCDVWFLA